ncbi:MAG TPA: lysine--tRNA ligase [Verrucomicrobiae bacterium]|nr:lysine--tRNA ligase [Verrucomicrobiae bacterium]
MDETNSLIEQRRAKLKALEAKGIFPFKNKFTPTETCADARKNYVEGREVAVAGRITAHREMGKSQFIDVRDQSGRLQIYAQKNHLEETAPGSWDVFTHLDLGDFIGAKGKLFTTKTGEISIKLDSFVILVKALRPPPEKWHGLADTEIRYRQRYLDLMANPDVKEIFLKRSQIIAEIRNFLHARGYVEVETPMMQAIPGGAAAQPFKTHHNALGCDFYLRIALELYLKRLLVGGVDKVFEIGRNFRNEGLSRKHNPEFTMLEAYQAFGDYETMMETVESLITTVAKNVLGTLVIKHDRRESFIATMQIVLERFDKNVAALSGVAFKMSTQLQSITLQKNRQKLLEIIQKATNEPLPQLANEAQQALANYSALFEPVTENYSNFPMTVELRKEADEVLNSFEKLPVLLKPFCDEKVIDLNRPWKRAKYKDLIREKAGADWFEVSPEVRRQRAHDLGAEIGKDYEDFEVTGAVFEKLIEPTLIQPTFVTHLPKELVPLAKLSPDDPTTVEVFECCINGQEISPGYTEQNDPIEQRERLEHQAGGEQQKLDEDFLVALEHGMPPAGGIGIGIDRLCMMLLGQESIRDVILFPQLKPK